MFGDKSVRTDSSKCWLSPGREETYGCNVPGQSIDVSTLPAGQYWLEAEVNTPSNPIINESDVTKDISRVVVTL